jgi:hypothetical protein
MHSIKIKFKDLCGWELVCKHALLHEELKQTRPYIKTGEEITSLFRCP